MLHVATSRPIGEKCRVWAEERFKMSSMEDCEVFISVLYDKLITQDYIDQHKCFNFHPGILPWYRGAGAYSWVIINGEFETGVTLHKIDRNIDHGDVIDIQRFPITETDTAETLFTKAEELIFEMFKAWCERLIQGDFTATQQVEGRIYLRKDLERVKDITRFKRAFTFEGKESAYYWKDGVKIYI